MLATPVARTLKTNFPKATITYASHASLGELLGCCDSVDRFVEYRKDIGLLAQRAELLKGKPDLIVDLGGTFKTGLLTAFSGARVVSYNKQSAGALPMLHAVDNFLQTLGPLSLTAAEPCFPTMTPPADLLAAMSDRIAQAGGNGRELVGLVPGVGKLRPHRAWIQSGWRYLAAHLKERGSFPVLIGGADDREASDAIQAEMVNDERGSDVVSGGPGEESINRLSGCLNLAGRLSLVETAALLKLCRLVVSGDTGPAHLAVAVGTPVVGLYGPTFPARSGPYGCERSLVDVSDQCVCHDLKECNVLGVPEPGAGDCMRKITLEQIIGKLEELTGSA